MALIQDANSDRMYETITGKWYDSSGNIIDPNTLPTEIPGVNSGQYGNYCARLVGAGYTGNGVATPAMIAAATAAATATPATNSVYGTGFGVDAGQVQCPFGDGYYNKADLAAHIAMVHPGQTAPGTTTPATAATGGTTMGTNSTIFAEADPAAYWMNKLGLSAIGGSPVNKWKMNQFAPAYSTWLGGSALEAAGGGTGFGSSFADYSGIGDYLGARTQAANVLLGAGGLGSEGEGTFRAGLSETELGQMIKAALASKYAAPVAQRLGGLWQDLETQYSANTQGTGDTFLSYLLSKYRL